MDAVKMALGHIESRSADPMTLGDVAEAQPGKPSAHGGDSHVRRSNGEPGAADLSPYPSKAFAGIHSITAIPNAIGDLDYGICARPSRRVQLHCGVEATSLDELPRVLRVPARRCAVFWHGDRISRIRSTGSAIFSEGLRRSLIRS